MHGMANRLQEAGRHYNSHVEASGTKIVCWSIFGILLFGLGPLIALHLEIKNLNAACFGYNQANAPAVQNNIPNEQPTPINS